MKICLDNQARKRPTDKGMNEKVLDFYRNLYLKNELVITKLKKNCRLYTQMLRYHGKLVTPSECSICRQPAKVDAHHPDYTEPKAIIWACRECHGKRKAGRTFRRQQAINGFVYASERVKTEPDWMRLQEAKTELIQILDEIALMKTKEAEGRHDRKIKAEQKLWKAEWGLKGALTRIATFYDPEVDRLY